MNTKKLASLAAASVVLLTSTVTASAETVNSNDLQEISVTLSVDEFADLASDYGCSVTIGGSGDIAEPQMHKTVNYTFTDSKFSKEVGLDSTLLSETVQLQDITFSDNIKAIEIRVQRHTTTKFLETITEQHSNSKPFGVSAGIQYRIFMKAIPKDEPLSEINQGTVSFYWTDRSWEVIE